jgi:unsaturated rhamnogalacturonyl hydrolase
MRLFVRFVISSVFAMSAVAVTHAGTQPNKLQSKDGTIWFEPVAYKVPLVTSKSLSPSLNVNNIADAANHVADWQLAQFDIRSNQMRTEDRASGLPEGWIYATWHIGLLRWGETTKDQSYIQAVRNMSAIMGWQLGPRLYHADDHAIGQVYLDLYQRYGDKAMMANVKTVFDNVLKKPSARSFEFEGHEPETMKLAYREFKDPWCTERWCWADAIFMAPPVWAELAKVTGDKRYLTFMDREFWKTTDYLYSKEDKLFLRDSRYFTKRDSNGKAIYWGRGNGWVLGGLARIIPSLPADFSKRADYIKLFQDMSQKLGTLQNSDGSWPSSLLAESTRPEPESSGTGLLIFGLAWGVNNGYLDRNTYWPIIEKGWQSLVASVDEKGRLGWVQQVAYAPGSATKDDTQLYGTGAFLLAASEVYKLVEANKFEFTTVN